MATAHDERLHVRRSMTKTTSLAITAVPAGAMPMVLTAVLTSRARATVRAWSAAAAASLGKEGWKRRRRMEKDGAESKGRQYIVDINRIVSRGVHRRLTSKRRRCLLHGLRPVPPAPPKTGRAWSSLDQAWAQTNRSCRLCPRREGGVGGRGGDFFGGFDHGGVLRAFGIRK